ncbi:hypothetical protein [Flexibacterium corallicola]|uniref:hypothetical protein n=1 Tax=Flexibacterium corallicola TaxID=3037259 RepID=UPI00286F7EE0|nr:hypothetical protein [Pseudovibrio sp. M1P-2-3]
MKRSVVALALIMFTAIGSTAINRAKADDHKLNRPYSLHDSCERLLGNREATERTYKFVLRRKEKGVEPVVPLSDIQAQIDELNSLGKQKGCDWSMKKNSQAPNKKPPFSRPDSGS